ncbi:hypothetical protein [Gramella sp. AN32]|uniref:Uncharacterized protein n=1 Tax=Christiangramia antarctica TaxID=2058158 RepID=A0ABW5X4F6_9FLAO|nr:hypothetical protein [Gramella sp. AN32]
MNSGTGFFEDEEDYFFERGIQQVKRTELKRQQTDILPKINY